MSSMILGSDLQITAIFCLHNSFHIEKDKFVTILQLSSYINNHMLDGIARLVRVWLRTKAFSNLIQSVDISAHEILEMTGIFLASGSC